MSGTILALDTASRQVSVAVARGDQVLASRQGAQRGSSAQLVDWIDGCLGEAGVRLDALAGAVALAGPGSFTGLRVGLATLLGFQQALGMAATTLPTLAVMAAATGRDGVVLPLVPAGPGEWFAQPWLAGWPPRPQAEPRRMPAGELVALSAPLWVVGSQEEAGLLREASGVPIFVCEALAPVAARLASLHPPTWDAALLQTPLYLAPAPASLPGAPKPVVPARTTR